MNSAPVAVPQLCRGSVMHARLRPVRNAFSYPVFFLRVPVSGLEAAASAVLAVDRFHLFSLHRRDHGPRDGSDLESWIRDLLHQAGCTAADGEIWLQAFPRVLGYVFNPVSFWLCHDRAGGLRAVLCEVNNTFGERHNYLVAHADGRVIEPEDVLQARKVFHVSPFCRVAGAYRFQFRTGPAHTHIRIDYDDGDGKLLATSVSGSAQPLRAGALLRCFFAYPWMTLGVILRIHWQALKLWAKGVPFFRKPPPPARQTTS